MTPLSTLLSRMTPSEQGLSLAIPPDWMQGRTAYGGLQGALVVAAMQRQVEEGLPLRSLQMSFIAPDCVYHNMPDEPVKGYQAVRELLSGYITGTDQAEIIVTNIAESANGTVLSERIDRFRMKGKVVDCPVMGAAEIVNGKITHWRDYYDNARLFAQSRT